MTTTYVSGARPFAEAAHIWAAAAGIAGAYFPAEFERLAVTYASSDVPLGALELLVAEAVRRADRRARYQDCLEAGLPFGFPVGSYIPPARGVLVLGRLEWQTSVVVALYPAESGGWEVSIEGEHTHRIAAAMAAAGDTEADVASRLG